MVMYISNDDGHHSIKTCYIDKNGEVKKSYIESRATIGDTTLSDPDCNRSDCFYTVDDVGYTVVDNASGNSAGISILNTQTPDYLYSDHNLAINHHSLYKAGVENEKIVLISSLPFGKFYPNGKLNQKLIDQKKNNLLRTNIEPMRNKIVDHFVMAEGVSGYFDLLYNYDCSVNENIKDLNNEKLIVIVDCGGGTTDISTFNQGKIDFSRSGSFDRGSLHLKSRIADSISSNHNYRNVSDNMLERIMRDHKLPAGDFTQDVIKCKKELSIEIRNYAINKIGNITDVGLIYFIGGTSILLREQFSEFYSPDILKFSDDALYSTASGMLKYLLRKKNNG